MFRIRPDFPFPVCPNPAWRQSAAPRTLNRAHREIPAFNKPLAHQRLAGVHTGPMQLLNPSCGPSFLCNTCCFMSMKLRWQQRNAVLTLCKDFYRPWAIMRPSGSSAVNSHSLQPHILSGEAEQICKSDRDELCTPVTASASPKLLCWALRATCVLTNRKAGFWHIK